MFKCLIVVVGAKTHTKLQVRAVILFYTNHKDFCLMKQFKITGFIETERNFDQLLEMQFSFCVKTHQHVIYPIVVLTEVDLYTQVGTLIVKALTS